MRLFPVAAVLCAVSVPAAAQSQAEVDAARRLEDPMVQEAIAMAVSSMAAIVLDTRVGALARLAGPDSDIRPSDTLRDVERRRDPDFEAKLHDDARRAVATAGALTGSALAMSSELQRTADRLKAALAPLAATVEQGAGDGEDDY